MNVSKCSIVIWMAHDLVYFIIVAFFAHFKNNIFSLQLFNKISYQSCIVSNFYLPFVTLGLCKLWVVQNIIVDSDGENFLVKILELDDVRIA